MDANQLDALKFSVNEKTKMASALMNQYRDDYNKNKYNFYYGQYLAYTEIYSMLNNIQN
jgi:hypothetical protein